MRVLKDKKARHQAPGLKNEPLRETLLDVRDEPIASKGELMEHCHRALSAQLWTTCCWPENGAGWDIGDFRFLVVSLSPDADTTLYVQFWSEPRQRVMVEVSSGEWNPGAIRYVGPAERRALEALGYTLGGRARNYGKALVIDSASAAEAAALEVLHILFDVFGYRGQWRLDVERHRGTRAEQQPVFTSVTPEDFAIVAVRAGCEATVKSGADTPFVMLRRGRRAFVASMDWQVSGRNVYSLIGLQADLRLTQAVPDEAIAQVSSSMHLVNLRVQGSGSRPQGSGARHQGSGVSTHDSRLRPPRAGHRTDPAEFGYTVRMHMPLAISGGVTAAWIARSLQHWLGSWSECERQLRRSMRAQQHRTSPGVELIH